MTDLTGRKFGDWTVLKYAGNKSWECQCSCGKIKNVRTYHLMDGSSTSCGHINKRRQDLTGETFGEWKVLEYVGNRYYKCQCSCGEIKNVSGYSLKSGKSLSCGHSTGALKDEAGNVYGELTVLEYIGDKKWICQCSCGKKVEALGKYLRSGQIVSCGHKRREDLTGRIFGNWTAIEYVGDNRWLCRCTCGNERNVLTQALVNGASRSCGCGGKDVRQNYRDKMMQKYGDISSNRKDKPRERWQIDVLESKEKLKNYILSITTKDKPSINTLVQKLDTSFSNIAKLIHKYELEDYLSIYAETSEEEKEVLQFIKSIYKGEILENDRKIIKPHELDIVVPGLKIAIEFNGDYWHSYPVKDKDYHLNKSIKCKERGYRLIHIFEYEWKNNQSTINKYLFNIFGDKRIIYGRNTIIKEISSEESKDFLNNNHLQGYIQSSITLGCYYNNILVGVMSFTKPRFNANYEYELLRLAWLSGYKVIGGTEKLFKFFKEKYNPNSIVTYCDIAKFTGEVYRRIGFELIENFKPSIGYVWVGSDGHIIKRYSSTKEKLIQSGLGSEEQTEDDIMDSLGYMKIYNCGNYTFIWKPGRNR